MKHTTIYGYLLLFLTALSLTACSSYIDDDLSDCPPDIPDEKDFELTYELRLVTNITTELTTQLNTTTDAQVADALRNHLQNIFTDYARDVDLSFYNTEAPQERLVHKQKVMDASERSYTIHLPIREYQHLAVANINGNNVVGLNGSDHCPTAQLLTTTIGETIDSHTTGLFTARQPMTVLEGVNQTFHVRLYMANCAASLVLDTLGSRVRDIRVFATGFATAFDVADSVYRYQYNPIIRADKVEVADPGSNLCYATVTFPSRMPETKAGENAAETYWEYRVYSYLPNGSITETKLSVTHPLGPAQLDILKAKVYGNGALEPDDVSVGVSVSLDWKPGMDHVVIL